MESNTWLTDVQLDAKSITLAPLTHSHVAPLLEAASDGELWNLWFTQVPSIDTIEDYVQEALRQKDEGVALPFVVIEKSTGTVIGSTRFCNADANNHRVEIGYTWYAKRVQKTAVNTESKLLLLTHAFETLNTIAVEFRTSWHNHGSRQAIARLGAKQDGVLRNHQKLRNGGYRDTVVFSIINSEWCAVKAHLHFQLNKPR